MKSLMIAASAAVLGLAVPALAQAQDAQPSRFYGNLGYAHSSGDAFDLGEVQGRLGYRALPWIGVEAEVGAGVGDDHYQVAPGVQNRVKLQHQEALYGVVFLPVGRFLGESASRFDVFARGGYGNRQFEVNQPNGTTFLTHAESWNYGAGLQFHLDGKNGIRADYTREDFVKRGSGANDVWSVAYSRRF